MVQIIAVIGSTIVADHLQSQHVERHFVQVSKHQHFVFPIATLDTLTAEVIARERASQIAANLINERHLFQLVSNRLALALWAFNIEQVLGIET